MDLRQENETVVPSLPERDADDDTLQNWSVPSAEDYKNLLLSKLNDKKRDFQNAIKKNFLSAMYDERQDDVVIIYSIDMCPLEKLYIQWFKEVIPKGYHPCPNNVEGGKVNFQVSFPKIV